VEREAHVFRQLPGNRNISCISLNSKWPQMSPWPCDQILRIRRVGQRPFTCCAIAFALPPLLFLFSITRQLSNCFYLALPFSISRFPFPCPTFLFHYAPPYPFCWLITCGYFDFNLLVSRSSVAVAAARVVSILFINVLLPVSPLHVCVCVRVCVLVLVRLVSVA